MLFVNHLISYFMNPPSVISMLPFCRALYSFNNLRCLRQFNKSCAVSSAYESDGKTTITILNKEPGFGLMIDSYSKHGFRLNNGMFVIGPMVLFPKTALSWNVAGDHDVHMRSLGLFSIIEPKLDILVIGYGKTPRPLVQTDIHTFRVNKKINVEVLPVEKAAPTFNYLCNEGRWVAGAFIPPANISRVEDEIMHEKLKRDEIYLD